MDVLLPTVGEIVASAVGVLLPGAVLTGLLWLLYRRRSNATAGMAASAQHVAEIRPVSTAATDGAMEKGLTLSVVEPDEDYLGIEVFVSRGRYAGSSRIFAGLDELGLIADKLEGFPNSPDDERTFELGVEGNVYAGGHMAVSAHTVDSLGHSVVDIEIVDDDDRYSAGSACFTVSVEAAGIDRFVQGLRAAQYARAGVARLASPS